SEDNKLMFNLTNSKSTKPEDHELARQGLENVRKRLDRLYTSEHELSISNVEGINSIRLELVLTDAITLPQNLTLIKNRTYEMEIPIGR
ncbi:MAG TPA: hypothetical protein VLA58_04405, partial [Chitinophagaceae bacterium]|nr:hypothetical protein [Chitinophagaceae bacterium]